MSKQNSFKLNKLYAVIALLSVQSAFAANFNIAPYGTLPTTVTTGQTVNAYFTVTNMTNSARNGYVVQGLPATVTQNTGGGNCGNPINLGPYPANCQLQLDITGAVSSNFAICKGNSCTTATTPLNVSETSIATPRFAYITQNNDTTNPSVTVCPVDSSTGFITGTGCVSAGGGISSIHPEGIQISNDGSTAYITVGNSGTEAYQCPINSTTGQFGTCTSTALTMNTGGPYTGVYGFLALNSSNTLAYIVANNAAVIACPVTGNTIQSSCTNTEATNIQDYGVGITLNANNSVAYIGNYDDSSYFVTTCAVSGDSFTACGNKTGGGTITFSGYGLQGVALNNTGTIVYLTDVNNSAVYGCDATSDTAATKFNNCFLASHVTFPWGLTLNAAGTMAYVTDYDTTVYACPISQVDGTFTSCTPTTGFTFSGAVDIALLY